MIQVTPHMRIFLAVEPVDFRKGIDGFCTVCKTILQEDPFSGGLFVFRNKSAHSIRILTYDGQGFWYCQKRLSKGKFDWWPNKSEDIKCNLDAHELQQLLWNGNIHQLQNAPAWRPIL